MINIIITKPEHYRVSTRKSFDRWRHNNTNYDVMWKSVGPSRYNEVMDGVMRLVKSQKPQFTYQCKLWIQEKRG